MRKNEGIAASRDHGLYARWIESNTKWGDVFASMKGFHPDNEATARKFYERAEALRKEAAQITGTASYSDSPAARGDDEK